MKSFEAVGPVLKTAPWDNQSNTGILKHPVLHWALRTTLFVPLGIAVLTSSFTLIDKIVAVYALAVITFGIDSRWCFGPALILLISIPAGQLLGLAENIIETLAILVFYLLCLGTVRAVIEARNPQTPVEDQQAAAKSQIGASTIAQSIKIDAKPESDQPVPVVRKTNVKHFDIMQPRVVRRNVPAQPEVQPPPSQPPKRRIRIGDFYRVAIFPLLVLLISSLGLVFASPYAQPLIERYYAKKEFSGFTGQESTSKAESAAPPATAESDKTLEAPIAIAKKDLKIQILNGNGIPGSAKKAADTLNAKGYAIAPENLGNAAIQPKTKIQAKKGQEEAARQAAADLSIKSYDVVSDLSETAPHHLVITLGKAL